MLKQKREKGFTLGELLVVIAIIGLLSAVIIGSLNTSRERGEDTARVSELIEINKAINLYYADHNAYPVASFAYLTPRENESDSGFIPNAFAGGAVPVDGDDMTLTPIEAALFPQYLPALPRAKGGKKYYYEGDGTRYCLAVELSTTNTPANSNVYCDNEFDNPGNVGIERQLFSDYFAEAYFLGNVTEDMGC